MENESIKLIWEKLGYGIAILFFTTIPIVIFGSVAFPNPNDIYGSNFELLFLFGAFGFFFMYLVSLIFVYFSLKYPLENDEIKAIISNIKRFSIFLGVLFAILTFIFILAVKYQLPPSLFGTTITGIWTLIIILFPLMLSVQFLKYELFLHSISGDIIKESIGIGLFSGMATWAILDFLGYAFLFIVWIVLFVLIFNRIKPNICRLISIFCWILSASLITSLFMII